MKLLGSILFITVGAFILQGCSSIINGTTQQVSVNSNVQGAEVFIDGVTLGTTPLINARIKRKDSSFLVVKKEGYKDYQQTLQTRFDNWFWGNLIIGGVVGSTTDLVSGTTHLLDPNTLYIQLEPVNGGGLKSDSANDQKLRTFVMTAYTQILNDIKIGKGEYLNSLFKLLNTSKNNELKVLEELRTISNKKLTIVEFSEETVKLIAK